MMKLNFAAVCMVVVSTLTTTPVEGANPTRQEILNKWTPEEIRKAELNSLSTDILMTNSDENAIRYRIQALENGLYHLIAGEPNQSGGGARALKKKASSSKNTRTLQTVLVDLATLEEPANGQTFSNPRSVNFKATVDPALEGTTMVFVNTAEGSETPSMVVEPDEVDAETGAIHELVGGFSEGEWMWYVRGTRNGKQVMSSTSTFTIEGSRRRRELQGTVGLADWENPLGGADGGQIQKASGRIYFKKGNGAGSACSGTAVRDNKTGRSLILTAGHCIWDDGWQSEVGWHSDVIFIPNREDTTDGNNVNCANNPCGCWTASAGILHKEYQTKLFPYNLPYDYGFFIVDDVDSHDGTMCEQTEVLELAVGAMDFKTKGQQIGQYMYGLGYATYWGKNLEYCSEMSTEKNTYFGSFIWLEACGLLGGSSGGPQLRNMNTVDGTGEVISVNSWGYGSNPGMGSVKIDDSAARCLMNYARNSDFMALEAKPATEQGLFVDCFDRPCEGTAPQLARKRALRAGMGKPRADCEEK